MARRQSEAMLQESELLKAVQAEVERIRKQVVAEIEQMRKEALAEAERIRMEAEEEAQRTRDGADHYAESVLTRIDADLANLGTIPPGIPGHRPERPTPAWASKAPQRIAKQLVAAPRRIGTSYSQVLQFRRFPGGVFLSVRERDPPPSGISNPGGSRAARFGLGAPPPGGAYGYVAGAS